MTGGKLRKENLPKLSAAFHQMHERIYTIKDEADVVEFTTWKVRAMGDTGGTGRRGRKLSAQQGTPQPKSRRQVYLGKAGLQTVPIYEGAEFGAGVGVAGPCVIELPTTTILLLEKQASVTDDHGNFLLETA